MEKERKTMSQFKDIDGSYIYHIQIKDTNKIYIGQSKASKKGSRL